MNHNSNKDNLEAQMDIAFTNAFLLPRKNNIEAFFTNLLNSKFDYLKNNKPEEIYVIDVWHDASSPLRFLFAEPCGDYYPSEKTINIAELNLDDYNFFDVEELGRKILDENNVDYSGSIDNGILDLAYFWENQFDLERQFLINCWKNAKEQTKSKILGFLQSADGAGGIYDLEDNYCLQDESVKEYLKRKGYAIKTKE